MQYIVLFCLVFGLMAAFIPLVDAARGLTRRAGVLFLYIFAVFGLCALFAFNVRAADVPIVPEIHISVAVERGLHVDARQLVNDASEPFEKQLGVRLVISQLLPDVGGFADEGVNALSEAQGYRLQHPDLIETSDLTLYLRARTLFDSTHQHEMVGYSSVGSFGHDLASTLVVIQDDGTDAEVIAHEIGHVLGAEHDGTGVCRKTPADRYVMAPAARTPLVFSDCSVKSMHEFLASHHLAWHRMPAPVVEDSAEYTGSLWLTWMYAVLLLICAGYVAAVASILKRVHWVSDELPTAHHWALMYTTPNTFSEAVRIETYRSYHCAAFLAKLYTWCARYIGSDRRYFVEPVKP